MRVAFLLLVAALNASLHLTAEQPPLKLADALAWKRIQTPIISNDGGWFAYKLVPNDGDSEIILTHLQDGKEQRFPIGQVMRPNPFAGGGAPAAPEGPPGDMAFSEDSKWLAFTVHATQKEAAVLKRQHKPVEDKAVLIELASQKRTDFERVKRFSFAGERSSAIAFHRYGASGSSSPASTAQSGEPATTKPDDKAQGSDLIVVDLPSGTELSVGNVSEFAFDKKGDWLAWLVDAQDKLGDGVELRNMANGSVMALDSAKATYKGLSWTEKGDGLAAVRGTEDKHWEDKLYTLLAFKNLHQNGPPEKFTFDPSNDGAFPGGMTISPDRRPMWMADLSTVTFGIKELKPKPPKEDNSGGEKSEEADDRPDLVIWHWKDRRLQPMQQVQENRDKAFSYLCAWQPGASKFVRLGDQAVRDVSLAPEGKFGVGTDVREYELESNLDGRRYQDVYRVDPKTGDRKLMLTKARWVLGASPDGTHLLHYNDGAFLSTDLMTGATHNLTKDAPAIFFDTEDDHNLVKPPTRPLGWSKDSQYVLLTDNWDIWKVPANGGKAINLTRNGKADRIRYQSIWKLDPDEKDYDLSRALYVKAYGDRSKKGGIGVINPGQTQIRMLHWDDAAYTNLLKARNTDAFLFSRETTQEYGDYYAAGIDLANPKKVTNADPQQKNFAWTKGTKLVEYIGSRGNRLQGVIYLPANYEPGKKYPTIVYIYEKLSQATNSYPVPAITGSGFNVGVYTSNGYAVLTPDIDYRVNDPGISSVACILAALKAAEATGIIDPSRVALHGHSWGGYQTAFAVTQTNVFKAAIAGAPLTDMVSMYSSIYWNTGSANQPIFESSQGRFSGGYWEQMQSYIRNSPVYHASQVQTPLLILDNDKDGAVDHTQGIEYYNTLRRLGKPVVMLEYKGENHGLYKMENMKDYAVRMKEFFDCYLADKPAPKWWTDGVPRLKMKEELEAREKEMKTPTEATSASVTPAGSATQKPDE